MRSRSRLACCYVPKVVLPIRYKFHVFCCRPGRGFLFCCRRYHPNTSYHRPNISQQDKHNGYAICQRLILMGLFCERILDGSLVFVCWCRTMKLTAWLCIQGVNWVEIISKHKYMIIYVNYNLINLVKRIKGSMFHVC